MDWKLSKVELISFCVGDDNPSVGVMVGDMEHDTRGAKEVNVPFIGVSYGFRNPEKMKKYPSIGLAGTPLDIIRIIQEREDR